MKLFAIRRRSAWADADDLGRSEKISAAISNTDMSGRVRWIRSYVIAERDGRYGTICIYQAQDEAAVREHANRVGMPGDEIEAIEEMVIVRPDPNREAA